MSEKPSLGRFIVALISGLALAVPILLILAMGECLPRDGSEAMRQCDLNKMVQGRSFVIAVPVIYAAAVLLHMRGNRLGEKMALFCGPLGLVCALFFSAIWG